MTALERPAVVAERPGTLASLGLLYRLVLRTQTSILRLVAIAGLGGLSILIGVLVRWDDDPAQASVDHISGYGLGVVVGLSTLWLGTSAIGDLIEDRLLAYLWLKPVARWQLPAAAVLATASVVIPLTAAPITVSALVAGAADVALPALLAATLGALAYASIFVALGARFRRGIWWGLAFVLLWENAAAHVAEGTRRFTVIGWEASLLGSAPDVDVRLEAGSATAALVVLPIVAVAAWLAGVWLYRRAEVD